MTPVLVHREINKNRSVSPYRNTLLVLRVDNVPKKCSRVKDQFFVTVTDLTTTKKTASISIKGRTVQWNKRFDAL